MTVYKLINRFATLAIALATISFLSTSNAQHEEGDVCVGYAGQTPRDIDSKEGTNAVVFELAPPATEMNLCNIHFHESAEHKAEAFSIYAGDGQDGYGSGYRAAFHKT